MSREAVDRPFGELVHDFLAGKKPESALTYRTALRRWLTWCRDRAVDPAQARRVHLETHRRWMLDSAGYAPATARTAMVVLRGFYEYAFVEGYIDTEPTRYIRSSAVHTQSNTGWYEVDQLKTLLAAADEDQNLSLRATVYLLAFHGLRLGEVVRARVSNLGYQGDIRTLKLETRKRNEGGEVLGLCSAAAEAVAAAVGERRSGYLVLVRGPKGGGDPMPVRMAYVRNWIYDLQKRAGLPRLVPHGLRHTFITLSREMNIPDRLIMASTGHRTWESMAYYDRSAVSIRNAGHQLELLLRHSPNVQARVPVPQLPAPSAPETDMLW